jgi:hypothetical protein
LNVSSVGFASVGFVASSAGAADVKQTILMARTNNKLVLIFLALNNILEFV